MVKLFNDNILGNLVRKEYVLWGFFILIIVVMYELRMGTDCFNTLFLQKKKNLLQYIRMILLDNISRNSAIRFQ